MPVVDNTQLPAWCYMSAAMNEQMSTNELVHSVPLVKRRITQHELRRLAGVVPEAIALMKARVMRRMGQYRVDIALCGSDSPNATPPSV